MSVAPGGFGVPVLTGGIDYSGAFGSGGGGFNLGNILQGGITAGLDSLLGGLFGGGSSGGSGGYLQSSGRSSADI